MFLCVVAYAASAPLAKFDASRQDAVKIIPLLYRPGLEVQGGAGNEDSICERCVDDHGSSSARRQ